MKQFTLKQLIMGCDIHMYIEYKRKNDDRDYWKPFGDRINPGRNYFMFGLLSKGVRSTHIKGIEPKGIPSNLGYRSSGDYWIIINDKYAEDEGFCSLENALKWQSYGCEIVNDSDGNPRKVSHPDWHSHSWLSTQEFKNQLDIYENEPGDYKEPEYLAILAAMVELEKHDLQARVVFWFDN